MDVVHTRRKSAGSRLIVPGLVVVLVGGAAYATLDLLHPRALEPVVDKTTIVTDVATRGDLLRAVRAPGTLVAQRVRVASASTDGTLETLPVHVGSIVAATTIVATMSNPDLTAAVIDARSQIAAADAELHSSQEEARASQLDKEAALDTAVADYRQVREQAVRYGNLHAGGLVSDYDNNVAQIKAGEARDAIAFDRRKIGVDAADAQAKIAAAQARVQQARASSAATEARVATLIIRAGASGVVQSLTVERGARLTAGTQLARIVGQRDLKATLEVPEVEIHDVVPGLAVSVDLQNGIARGHVARIDPAAQNGAIAVDVDLEGDVPPSARPDLHVDGTIEFERLHQALSIARPANAADNSTIDLYRLVDGGTRAVRTRVRLGRGSVERVAVLSGLAPGTTVIVSDPSAFNDAPTLRVQ